MLKVIAPGSKLFDLGLPSEQNSEFGLVSDKRGWLLMGMLAALQGTARVAMMSYSTLPFMMMCLMLLTLQPGG